MSVIIETTLGDLTVDLYVDERPRACLNFLKLCKTKYYNYCVFHSVQRNFVAQTGDPTGTGRGGESVFQSLYGDQARFFEAETKPKIKHRSIGLDVLAKINEAFCDKQNRPYQDIRVTHTVILDDPLDDPPGLVIPDRSPEPTKEQIEGLLRIGADEEIDETKGLTEHEVTEKEQKVEADHRAQVLEIIGDLPDKDVKPPDNVLFVCKLNPVTTDEDLEIIFSRFGKILSCEIIRDYKSGDSLQYAFIEFETADQCEKAYLKMDNVLIDDRRIHVDFSQSVSKMDYRRSNKPEERAGDEKNQRSQAKDGRKKNKKHRGSDEERRKRSRKQDTSDSDSAKEVRCGKHSKRRSYSSDYNRKSDEHRHHQHKKTARHVPKSRTHRGDSDSDKEYRSSKHKSSENKKHRHGR